MEIPQLENILVDVVRDSDNNFWHQREYQSLIHNWDDLAISNPIHAAIATNNEEQEREKSKDTIEILRNNLCQGVILDVGCGYGRILKLLSLEHAFDGYIGVDSSIVMLSLFSKRYNDSVLEQKTPLVLVNANIDNLPIKDNSVDNAIVSAVFLHNQKSVTQKSINEIRRVLKPGGKIFILSSFPNKASLTGLQGEIYLFILKIFGKGTTNGPVRYFFKKEVENMLRGFSWPEIIPTGFAVLPKTILILPNFLNNIYKRPAQKINSWLASFLPRKPFCTHYDAIVEK
jgi:ubiquinone/menaquinone biosynthesis C-methylase UbiE